MVICNRLFLKVILKFLVVALLKPHVRGECTRLRGGRGADSGAGASAPSEKGHCGGPGVVSAVTSRAGADNLVPSTSPSYTHNTHPPPVKICITL